MQEETPMREDAAPATSVADYCVPTAAVNAWVATALYAADMNKKSKNIALAGVFTALCTVFLFIGSIFQTLDLSAAAFGSLIILVAMIELGKSWAFGIYAASSLLSLLLLPYKTAALVFACFAGFYPVLKAPLNRIKNIVLSYAARIAIFNIFLTAMIFVATRFLNIQEDFFGFGVIIYALSNLTFIAYDFAIERFADYYIQRLKKLIFPRR